MSITDPWARTPRRPFKMSAGSWLVVPNVDRPNRCRTRSLFGGSRLNQLAGFDSRAGHCRVGESGCPRRAHNPETEGSNPSSATNVERKPVRWPGRIAHPIVASGHGLRCSAFLQWMRTQPGGWHRLEPGRSREAWGSAPHASSMDGEPGRVPGARSKRDGGESPGVQVVRHLLWRVNPDGDGRVLERRWCLTAWCSTHRLSSMER